MAISKMQMRMAINDGKLVSYVSDEAIERTRSRSWPNMPMRAAS